MENSVIKHLNLKSMETEREKFRAYIEKSGLMSALTNALVTLYEEPDKPKDALNYVITSLGCRATDYRRMEVLEQKCKDLEAENQMLKEQLLKLSQQSAGLMEEAELQTSCGGTDSVKEET